MELDQLDQSLLGDTKTAPGCQATETVEHHIDAFCTLLLAATRGCQLLSMLEPTKIGVFMCVKHRSLGEWKSAVDSVNCDML